MKKKNDKKKTVCPWCGSPNVEWMGDEYPTSSYYCHECDWWFGKDDLEREPIRKEITALLTGNELPVPIPNIPINDSKTVVGVRLALSLVLEFMVTGEPDGMDFDEIPTESLKKVLTYLKEENRKKESRLLEEKKSSGGDSPLRQWVVNYNTPVRRSVYVFAKDSIEAARRADKYIKSEGYTLDGIQITVFEIYENVVML